MNMNEYNEIQKTFQKYQEELVIALEKIRNTYCPNYDYETDIVDYNFDTKIIEVDFSQLNTKCSCCDNYHWSAELPMDIVVPEMLDKYILERNAKAEKEKKDRKMLAEQEKKSREIAYKQSRKSFYEELKREFGD